MRSPFSLNRLIVLVAGVLQLVAIGIFVATGGPSVLAEAAPLLLGFVGAIILAFWAPRWMYLVAAVLIAAFPLLILFVFGAYAAITHPGGGAESLALTILLLSAIVGIIGGVAGFVQAPRGQPRPGDFLRTGQGLGTALTAALFVGLMVSSVWTGSMLRDIVVHSANAVEPDETVLLVAQTSLFAPREVTIPVGKVVALHIENKDSVMHTFAYKLGGVQHESPVPPETEVDFFFNLKQAQTIRFWCSPHSGGESDTDPASMWGSLRVE